MQSAVKISTDIVAALPTDRLSPETTRGKEGFVHPNRISGTVEEATIEFIIRDHNTALLDNHQKEVENIVKTVIANYPKSTYHIEVQEQYRNMKEVLDQHPEIMEIGIEAIRRAGMEPERRSIRGGTDGSRLSFMGLPCPNVFAGGHAFHGKQEWVSRQDMEKAVKTILHIAALWEERA
ncbi:M20/M25/M40 family metallo-hydrolase, partial [Brucella sp. 21LCYQ03]|nr:M20/M25/M40 family metallo-hydrolase [Brucella sp. 21LCYQ03]